METLNNESNACENEREFEKITPWYLLTLIKPIIAEELVAKLRFDRTGIRINFCNGQKFHLKIEEIK